MHPTDPRAPRYREAYPSFDVNRAQAAYLRGEVCAFFGARGHQCGVAFVSMPDHGRFVLEYVTGGPHWGFGDQGLELAFESVPNSIDEDRIAVRCPGCGRRKYILVFKGHWSCPDCHKLVYRSQLVDKDTLLWEQREALRARIGKYRPLGMHNATYAKLCAKRKELDKALRGKGPRFAIEAHSYLARSEWRRPEDLPIPVSDYARFSLVGGRPCVRPNLLLP